MFQLRFEALLCLTSQRLSIFLCFIPFGIYYREVVVYIIYSFFVLLQEGFQEIGLGDQWQGGPLIKKPGIGWSVRVS